MLDKRLVSGCHEAALFLLDQIENHGWKKWSWNYLREHVRCKTGLPFTNTVSPEVYKAMRAQYPEISRRIDRQEDLFAPPLPETIEETIPSAYYDNEGRFIHNCAICGRGANRGYGVSIKRGQLGAWFCSEHLPTPTGLRSPNPL
jgi:hypothetical protein